MRERGFAVMSCETTGLIPGTTSRISEIAIVHLSADGTVEGQWSTRIQTGDVPPVAQRRDRRSSDTLAAPTFDRVAPRLLGLLGGRVLVAHNASLPTRFVMAELERHGYGMPGVPVTLSTMHLARTYLPGSPRLLGDCCAEAGITIDAPMVPSVVAFATARLLASFLRQGADDGSDPMPASAAPTDWSAPLAAAQEVEWPLVEARADAGAAWTPRLPIAIAPPSVFLSQIVAQLPGHSGPVEHLDYLDALDRCLQGGFLGFTESLNLEVLAEQLGISRFVCETLHREYFGDVACLAWTARTPSSAELELLWDVGTLLDLPASIIAMALATPVSSEQISPTRSASRASLAAVPIGSGGEAPRPASGRFASSRLAALARLLAN
jgi:DNA polymerase-3 subunit epsilon